MIKLLRLVPKHILEERDELPVAQPLAKPNDNHSYNKAASDLAGEQYEQKSKDFSHKIDNGESGADDSGIIKT